MAIRRSRSIASTRHTGETNQSPEALQIAAKVAEMFGDKTVAESVELSTTLLTRLRQMIEKGGTLVTDTNVMLDSLDRSLLMGTNLEVKCFLESAEVKKLAERKMTSRAEVAVDTALALPGPKLMVIGSAPAALGRILQRRTAEPLTDVYVMTAVSGFVSAVALKEKLRESNMTYGIIRGKNRGMNMTAALVNCTLDFIIHNK